mgnify:CR=1 FL=1
MNANEHQSRVHIRVSSRLYAVFFSTVREAQAVSPKGINMNSRGFYPRKHADPIGTLKGFNSCFADSFNPFRVVQTCAQFRGFYPRLFTLHPFGMSFVNFRTPYLGLGSVAALRGRTDLLMHLDYENEAEV